MELAMDTEKKCPMCAEEILSTYKILRKYLNQNPVIFEPFDTGKFIDLCKKQ